mmetsp:Transcript_131517/g.262434  ORF Transcript_131517/g.262434 Transcript_131517/m.262434 type:complete len:250 (-) Transcript_131517:46-795(-)
MGLQQQVCLVATRARCAGICVPLAALFSKCLIDGGLLIGAPALLHGFCSSPNQAKSTRIASEVRQACVQHKANLPEWIVVAVSAPESVVNVPATMSVTRSRPRTIARANNVGIGETVTQLWPWIPQEECVGIEVKNAPAGNEFLQQSIGNPLRDRCWWQPGQDSPAGSLQKRLAMGAGCMSSGGCFFFRAGPQTVARWSSSRWAATLKAEIQQSCIGSQAAAGGAGAFFVSAMATQRCIVAVTEDRPDP